jgi:hypothetical protein
MQPLVHLAYIVGITYIYIITTKRLRDNESYIDVLQIQIDDLKKEVKTLKKSL